MNKMIFNDPFGINTFFSALALIAWLNYISSLGIFINQDFRCFFTLTAMPLEILHPLGHIKS